MSYKLARKSEGREMLWNPAASGTRETSTTGVGGERS